MIELNAVSHVNSFVKYPTLRQIRSVVRHSSRIVIRLTVPALKPLENEFSLKWDSRYGHNYWKSEILRKLVANPDDSYST